MPEEKKVNEHTVLLVEDDEYIQKAYKIGLGDAGFKVVSAEDGKEGLEKMNSAKPDVILLDLVMPVMDGFEFLKKIKEDDNFKDIPVIVLSNLAQGPDIERARELGAVDYLIKTDFWMEEVIKKVNSHLGKGKG
jgi:DNA-binding response OmpR family regulator